MFITEVVDLFLLRNIVFIIILTNSDYNKVGSIKNVEHDILCIFLKYEMLRGYNEILYHE